MNPLFLAYFSSPIPISLQYLANQIDQLFCAHLHLRHYFIADYYSLKPKIEIFLIFKVHCFF